ncbi:MAG TPA: methyltransferase domain-containing protein [Clostridiaceae bacterium]|nr:methyltransferase domain-containing protein [Clostridiaceae bacterium]
MCNQIYNNKSIKKKDKARNLINESHRIFKCPVCSSPMFVNDSYSLICKSRHCFDISKKGYLNLLTSINSTVYSKELFEARHKVCAAGFYDPLINMLSEAVINYKNLNHKEHINILDAGCGEGSHICGIFKIVQSAQRKQSQNIPEIERSKNIFLGVDISKESINMAAGNDSDIIWCVADLAKLPFRDKCIDVLLNILSPANYGEFYRILNDDGIIVKVVPGPEYLREIRETIYDKNATYSNSRVIKHFREKLDIIDIQNVKYRFYVNEELLEHFIKMTPLTWGKSSEDLNEVFKKDISHITVDLDVIFGSKKNCIYSIKTS